MRTMRHLLKHMAIAAATCASVLVGTGTAQAQLGSVNNPPREHLFNFDNGTARDARSETMAQRRARLAQLQRRPRGTTVTR